MNNNINNDNNDNERIDIKPKLGFLEMNSGDEGEGEFFSPVPNRPKMPEYRMTSELLKKDEFKRIIHGPIDIIKIYNNAKKIKNLGAGATSEGEVIKLEEFNKFYIIKRTNFNEEANRPRKILSKIKGQLINEQLIYQILERDPEYKKYISNLLYADVPLILHHTPEYNYSYFIFEYNEGVSLAEFIDTLVEKNQKVSYEDVMTLVGKINNALNFIHRNGIIHRDLKPDNIFIDFSRNNLPLLIDFDISCRIGVDCEVVEFIGTEKYATNGAKKIKRKGDKLSFDSYTYSENSDRYALVRIIEEDLIKIIKPEDIMKLKHQIDLLKPLKLLGGNRMRRNRTRKVRGGECKIGVLFPRFGGKRKTIRGGRCPCEAVAPLPRPMGGYRPTKRNLKYLKMWKRGESIGFTMRSSLKAKGLIPRANGTKRISPKYR